MLLKQEAGRGSSVSLGANAVASRSFGSVERLVRGLEHLVRGAQLLTSGRHADTDRHPDDFAPSRPLTALLASRTRVPPLRVAQHEAVFGDGFKHIFVLGTDVLGV